MQQNTSFEKIRFFLIFCEKYCEKVDFARSGAISKPNNYIFSLLCQVFNDTNTVNMKCGVLVFHLHIKKFVSLYNATNFEFSTIWYIFCVFKIKSLNFCYSGGSANDIQVCKKKEINQFDTIIIEL